LSKLSKKEIDIDELKKKPEIKVSRKKDGMVK